jgi:hypothetical protein
MNFRTYSFRFAEQVLNSKLAIKQEIEGILQDPKIIEKELSRPHFNELLKQLFTEKGWQSEAPVFELDEDPSARMDFLKERIGIEVGFGHASFIGIDLLKFQVSSYSGLDKIDIGIYILTTSEFQKRMKKDYNQNWEGSLTFEKVKRYLPHFKSAIQVPVWVIGLL